MKHYYLVEMSEVIRPPTITPLGTDEGSARQKFHWKKTEILGGHNPDEHDPVYDTESRWDAHMYEETNLAWLVEVEDEGILPDGSV